MDQIIFDQKIVWSLKFLTKNSLDKICIAQNLFVPNQHLNWNFFLTLIPPPLYFVIYFGLFFALRTKII